MSMKNTENFILMLKIVIIIGNRIPAIFVFSHTYRLHMTTQLGWNGNSQYNNAYLKQNQYSTLVMQQTKVWKYLNKILLDLIRRPFI